MKTATMIQNSIEESEVRRSEVGNLSELVGKCFKTYVTTKYEYIPNMWRYYKIIDGLFALTFDEYPYNYFNEEKNRFYFNAIKIDILPVFGGITWVKQNIVRRIFPPIEINLDEYNIAMNLYIDRLQKITWDRKEDNVGI